MAAKPVIVCMGTPPASIVPRLDKLRDDFTVMPHQPESLDALLASLRDRDSSIYQASALLRLGTQATTGLPIGWTGHISDMATLPPNLQLLVNLGHGLDKEDVAGAAAKGLTVRGTTGGVDATATVGVYLTIAAFRQLGAAERAARSGDPARFVAAMHRATDASVDPQGKTVGIIGYGRIGQQTGRLLRALGMHIACMRRRSPDAAPEHASAGETIYDSLDAMVAQVHCILLACPYTPETHHIINWARIQTMKPGVRIVNIARGACIDEDALVRGVRAGIVAGVGLDVYETEPRPSQQLLDLDCATLLPHIGGLSVSSAENHWNSALDQVVEFFQK